VVRAARLSAALTGLAQDLAGARREIAVLRRENMELRARLDVGAPVEMGRHERAVARSLAFAQDAATEGDFVSAVRWLQVVQAVDGGLPPDWERTLAGWIDRKRTTELGCPPAIASTQTRKGAESG
jgi:hypothetical protein